MGIVYLICPGYLKGLNRYKIGCSQHDNVSRVSSYGKDTVVFSIQGGLSNYQEVEQAIIKAFDEHFTVVSGREYYEGDIHRMKELFNNTIKSCENFEQNAEVPQEPLNENKEKVSKFLQENVKCTQNSLDPINVNSLFTCNHCTYSTKVKSNLTRHLQRLRSCASKTVPIVIADSTQSYTVLDATRIRCNQCNRDMFKKNFKRHALRCKKVAGITCPACLATFKYASGLSQHKKKFCKQIKQTTEPVPNITVQQPMVIIDK